MRPVAVAAAACLLAGCGAATPTASATIALPTGSPTPPPPTPSPPPTASATPLCLPGPGTWREFSYPGVAVAIEIPALVYLPGCYAADDRNYPAVYLLHGSPYDEQHWIDLGLGEAMDAAVTAGTTPEAILVLARSPEPLFSGTDGGPGSYEQELLQGLVPAVDRTFRTERKALVGISRGGVWALEIGMRHPVEFAAVGALSPALSVNYARPMYDPLKLVEAAPALPERIFLAAGETDWALPATRSLAQALDSRPASVVLQVVPGGHGDDTWRALIPAVLAFLQETFAPR